MGEALFYAFFLGLGLAAFYDLLRLFRLSFGTAFVFDLIFWIVCAIFSFSYLLIFNNGEIRWMYFAALLAGFFVYFLLFGKITFSLEKRIAKKVKIRLKKFKKVLQLPSVIYYNIKAKIRKPNHKEYEGDAFDKGKQI